ncbi:hypothetical protein Anas_04263 [Armadillidium nasatum]|uniref:Uncharacterized protein n=1 Tax=Armadillidium nasatum TaxID=96803 RepID=A0A5N5T8F8_9CRUS|nr:hypothetical protein Anas_04263 [Armadillidium nasatum]
MKSAAARAFRTHGSLCASHPCEKTQKENPKVKTNQMHNIYKLVNLFGFGILFLEKHYESEICNCVSHYL